MKREKAINILKEQREKLNHLNASEDEHWERVTQIQIKQFFGESSSQFRKKECLDVSGKGDMNFSLGEEHEKTKRDGLIKKASQFLTDCIADLEEGEVYMGESKWAKWFKEPENWWKILVFIVGTAITIVGAVITVLKYIHSVKE